MQELKRVAAMIGVMCKRSAESGRSGNAGRFEHASRPSPKNEQAVSARGRADLSYWQDQYSH